VAVETRAPATPPASAPTIAVDEGEAITEVTATRATLGASSQAGPSVDGVVTVLDEGLAPPPPSVSRDAAMPPALEPAQLPVTANLLPAVEVLVSSPTVGAQGPCDRIAQNNSVLSPNPVHVAIKQ
jgi:hypothetical protein